MRPKPLDLSFEWDWLIILDACRYDYFSRLWRRGKVEPRLSPGSCTLEFLNWIPSFKDAVVITGHPFVLERYEKFGEVIDAGFDNNLNTTPPWYVTKVLERRYSYVLRFRRRILWFLQPHHPCIGNPRLDAGIFTDPRTKELMPQGRTTLMYMKAKRKGILSKAYESNLKLALREIERIWPLLHGKVVITSDHGEGLGEPLRSQDKPVFSHPCARSEWEVRLVPFVVVNNV